MPSAEPTIICPKCKAEIKLTESLAAPLVESIRLDYEKRLTQKDADMARRETTLCEREAAMVTASLIYMLEPKRKEEMTDPDVIAKQDAAVKWCKHASDHAKTCKGKPWKYALIPHDVIAENVTLEWLGGQSG